jgi:hypothetical protein
MLSSAAPSRIPTNRFIPAPKFYFRLLIKFPTLSPPCFIVDKEAPTSDLSYIYFASTLFFLRSQPAIRDSDMQYR